MPGFLSDAGATCRRPLAQSAKHRRGADLADFVRVDWLADLLTYSAKAPA
jgi:hypothetical protein